MTAVGCGVGAEAPHGGDAQSAFAAVGRVRDDALGEISGLAVSQRDATVYWAINDSGNDPALFAIDAAGERLARVDVDGVPNRDWEDLVSWQDADGRAWLAIADIGDNGARRPFAELLIVAEPGLEADRVAVERRLRFTWEGGPRDAESLAFDATGQRFLLIDKRNTPIGLFELPLDGGAGPQVARRIADVAALDTQSTDGYGLVSSLYAGMPTAADISPDGRRLLVLAYTHLALFERAEDETWSEAVTHAPRFYPLPIVPQLEAIAWDADGGSALLAPERRFRGVPVYRWSAPTR